MKQKNLIVETNYSIARNLVMGFANCVESTTKPRIKMGLRREAFKVIQEYVENTVLRAELATLYNGLVLRNSEVEDPHKCWRGYIAQQEEHKHPVDENGQMIIPPKRNCGSCVGNTYETGDDSATVGFCGKHDSLEGKL